jgi:hypothetical protein
MLRLRHRGNLALRDVYRDETPHPALSLTVSRGLARVGRSIRPEAQAHHEQGQEQHYEQRDR